MILQVVAISTSFVSLSYGFVSFRQEVEEELGNSDWTWKDMVVDMVWNILTISSRVVALSLFATYELYWFWGLVGSQIVVVTVVCFVFDRIHTVTSNFLMGLFFSLVTGVGMVFRMFITFNMKVYFYFYLLYWFLIFTENTAMISLSYVWSSDLGFWYHEWAISGVIVVYFLSLIVKVLHCYFYNRNEKNIMKWMYSDM